MMRYKKIMEKFNDYSINPLHWVCKCSEDNNVNSASARQAGTVK